MTFDYKFDGKNIIFSNPVSIGDTFVKKGIIYEITKIKHYRHYSEIEAENIGFD